MGKATILNNLGSGKYLVRLDLDTTAAQATRQIIFERINIVETETIPALEADRAQAQIDFLAAQSELDVVIQRFSDDEITIEELSSAHQIFRLGAEIRRIQADVIFNQTQLELASLNEELKKLDALVDSIVSEAWCADYTENLEGEVGTIDIESELFENNTVQISGSEIVGGQKNLKPVILRPGFFGDAKFNANRDGQFSPINAGSASAAFYNAALLPGLQKWYPGSRVAMVDKVSDETLDVTLNDAHSNYQNININQQTTFEDVEVKYMSCGSSVFSVGDTVVVEFMSRNIANPVVIGFVDNPKLCTAGFVAIPVSDSAPGGWGQPFADDGGVAINAPLGTVGGSHNQVIFRANPSAVSRDQNVSFGRQAWAVKNQGDTLLTTDTSRIYRRGAQYARLPVGETLRGAALTPSRKYIIAVTARVSSLTVWRKINKLDLSRSIFDAITAPEGWHQVDTLSLLQDQMNWGADWQINQSCSRATSQQSFTHPTLRPDFVFNLGPEGDNFQLTANSFVGTFFSESVDLVFNGIDSLNTSDVSANLSKQEINYINLHTNQRINNQCFYTEGRNSGGEYVLQSRHIMTGQHQIGAAFDGDSKIVATIEALGAGLFIDILNEAGPNGLLAQERFGLRDEELTDFRNDSVELGVGLKIGSTRFPFFTSGLIDNSSWVRVGTLFNPGEPVRSRTRTIEQSEIIYLDIRSLTVVILRQRETTTATGAIISGISNGMKTHLLDLEVYVGGSKIFSKNLITNIVEDTVFSAQPPTGPSAACRAILSPGETFPLNPESFDVNIENRTFIKYILPFHESLNAPKLTDTAGLTLSVDGQSDFNGNTVLSLSYAYNDNENVFNFMTSGDIVQILQIQGDNPRLLNIGVI